MEPNTLTLRRLDRPTEVVRAGGPGLQASTTRLLRTPAGHPEGYVEAFANLYRAFAAAIRGEAGGWFPRVSDGLRTMNFIEAVVANAGSDRKWTSIDPEEAA